MSQMGSNESQCVLFSVSAKTNDACNTKGRAGCTSPHPFSISVTPSLSAESWPHLDLGERRECRRRVCSPLINDTTLNKASRRSGRQSCRTNRDIAEVLRACRFVFYQICHLEDKVPQSHCVRKVLHF